MIAGNLCGLRLFVSSLEDVTVEEAAPVDPFSIPLQSFEDLLLFSGAGESIQRIKVRGTVTYVQAGQRLYIQDGNRGVFVLSRQDTPIALGSQVEVVGYPSPGRYSPTIDDALFRQVGPPQPITPIPASAGQMVVVNKDGFATAPYDSSLVQLNGQLVSEVRGRERIGLSFKTAISCFRPSCP